MPVRPLRPRRAMAASPTPAEEDTWYDRPRDPPGSTRVLFVIRKILPLKEMLKKHAESAKIFCLLVIGLALRQTLWYSD